MSSNPDRIEFLKEHLAYELSMLRYTADRLETETDQAAWNAFYESFVVHLRLLYRFLVNADDARDFQANAYIDGFKSEKGLAGTVDKMHRQVLHAGKRVSDAASKVHLEDVRRCHRWIEGEFYRFLGDLPKEYAPAWDWTALPARVLTTPASSPLSATNSIQILSWTGPATPPAPKG